MISKLKSLLKNKDAKKLLENFISLSSLQLVGMILPLITLPYVLRVLGFSNYGIVVLAASLVAYFQSVVDYSFRITATRDVAVFKSSPKRLNIIYSKVLTVKAFSLLFSFFSIFLIVYFYPPFFDEKLVFSMTALMLFGYALFPEWFFQGIEEMKYISLLNIGIKLFFTICVFLFIKEEQDYWLYPLLQSLGYIFAGMVGQWILVRKYKLKFFLLNRKIIKNTIKANFPVFINQFFPTLYNNTTSFLLGIITSTSMLGIYDAIRKVVDLCVTLINIISRVFFPFLNRRKDVFLQYRKLMLIVGIGLAFLPLISHNIVFWYLNVTYSDSLLVLTILSFGIVGMALYDIYGVNFFLVNHMDRVVMKNTILVSLIGFLTAFPLIYYLGITGAALNLAISRLLMGIGLNYRYILYTKTS